MPDYRRWFVHGGTFFFTVVTANRKRILCQKPALELLRSAIVETRRRWPFAIDAIVVLPDHLHTIWTLPDTDADFSTRWAFLKKTFTKAWLAHGGQEQPISDAQRRHRRRGVWQRKFWEHMIRDEEDFGNHCNYIHFNPVRHGVASCPHAWPYSSFRRWVKEGIYRLDWHCVCDGRIAPAPKFGDLSSTAME